MQQQNNTVFPLMISIVVMDAVQMRHVYALLGGAAITSYVASPESPQRALGNALSDTVKQDTADGSVGAKMPAPASPESDGTGPSATNASHSDDGELDAHGHPWSADLHASTRNKTKDGLWRMKVGVTRPDPKPGFPTNSAATGTSPETGTPSVTSQTAPEPASAPAATAVEEDDEFAAFRAAAATSDAADQAAAASVPAERQFSDADLGALCNQAAVKLGDPNPVKEIIASYTPAGEVAHSRNIPADKRAEFVKKVEEKAGIEFAG